MHSSALHHQRARRFARRRVSTVVLAVGLTVVGLGALGAAPAGAATVCTADVCVVVPDTVQTPLGLVTVTVSPTQVVTVHLEPVAPNTLVIGVPFTLPPGVLVSGCPGGCSRTTIDTAGGVVAIDTIQFPPRFTRPSLAIISIHPPSPCRARTIGTTVTFTPIIPPGPPN